MFNFTQDQDGNTNWGRVKNGEAGLSVKLIPFEYFLFSNIISPVHSNLRDIQAHSLFMYNIFSAGKVNQVSPATNTGN